MNVYLYTLVLLFFIGCSKKNNQKLIMYGILGAMMLSLATQYRIGIDYDSYIFWFKHPESRKDLEVGYRLYTNFLRIISTNPQIVFIGMAVLQVGLLGIILKKMIKDGLVSNIAVYIFCFCCITDGYYLFFNSLRSSVASLFFILSLIYLEESKIIKTIILLVLGFTFHKSMVPIFLLTIILIFILKKNFLKKVDKFWVILYIIICIYLNRINFIPEVSKMIYKLDFESKYKFYLISEHMRNYSFGEGYGMVKIARSIIGIGLSSLYIKDKNEKNELKLILYNLGYFVLGLKFLFWGIPIFNRPMEYFNIPLAYIYYMAVNRLKNRRYGMLIVIMGLYFLLEFLVTIYRIIKYLELTN